MKNKRIVFLGTHGQMNIGDELLLETFLRQLGADNTYYVNSYDPQFTAAQLAAHFKAEVFNTATERTKLLAYLRRCDLLFFGGGSIIKELYASVGRNPYSTLLMVLAIVTYTRQVARRPIVMSNIGVGPLHTPRGRQLAGLILRQVHVLSVRDRKSYETCLQLGLSPQVVQRVPDAVFVNPPAIFGGAGELGCERTGAPGTAGAVRLALNLNYDIENPANWETFQTNLADGLAALHVELAAGGRRLEVHTLPMQAHFKAMHDGRVLEEFRARIPQIDVHVHQPRDHREAAAIIRGCDLLLAERLHALVMAAILGKPFVALMYDVKVRELVGGLGMEGYSLDINRPFEPLRLKELLECALVENGALGRRLAARSTALRGELDDYFGVLGERLGSARKGAKKVGGSTQQSARVHGDRAWDSEVKGG
jgi:polysaccharide pyruvyl transferase WcaK-like protein